MFQISKQFKIGRDFPDNMKEINTVDGSITYYNEDFNECYHTKAGALSEARIKHVEPANLKELAKKGEVRILDICFGLGYNTIVALDELLEENCKIFVVGLENDEKIIEKIPMLELESKGYEYVNRLAKEKEYSDDKVDIKLIIDDARNSIKELRGFDVVFFDPFSPKNCPELWTEEFFSDVKEACNVPCVLTTFSCAKSVRENLAKAGFKVEDGPVFGKSSPGTIGRDNTFL